MGGIDSHQVQCLRRPPPDLVVGGAAVRLEGVLELRSDALHRIECVHGALHDHRVVTPAHVAELATAEPHHVVPAEGDLAVDHLAGR